MDVQKLRTNNFYFGRRALKNADRQLVPAIVAYQFAVSSLGFGLLCLAVGYFRSAELPDFLKKITKDPEKKPAGSEYERYFFYALAGIAIVVSLISIMVAGVCYLRYRSAKKQEAPNADGDEENPEPLCQPPAPGSLPEGSYPTQKVSSQSVDSDGHMASMSDARPGDTSSL